MAEGDLYATVTVPPDTSWWIPTIEDLRSRSELLRETYPEGDGDEALQLLLDDDMPVVSQLTGRAIGIKGTPGVPVPVYLRGTAIRVLALRAERSALIYTSESRTETIGDRRLKSISAGPWSESYFGPGEIAESKMLDPDQAIHDLLWALCTDDMRDYWHRIWGMGVNAPYAAVRSFPRGRSRVRRQGY